jgi:hypothetical protein
MPIPAMIDRYLIALIGVRISEFATPTMVSAYDAAKRQKANHTRMGLRLLP